MHRYTLLICGVLFTHSLFATPPMGMHTWYLERPTSESLVLAQFDRMTTNGWKEAGYNLVVIDDTWQGTRNASGVLLPNPDTFPHGISWLAAQAHMRGMKLGIYTEPTLKTSAGKTGSEGHLAQDADTFVDWGIDFIKFDMGLVPEDQLEWRPEADTAEFAQALQRRGWKGHLHLGIALARYGPWVFKWAQSWRGSYGVPAGSTKSPGIGVDVCQSSGLEQKLQILQNWDRMMAHAADYGPGRSASFDSCPSWFADSDPAGFRFCVSLFAMGGVDMFCHSFRASGEGDANFSFSKALLTGEYVRINQDVLCSPPERVQGDCPDIHGTPKGSEVWKRRLGNCGGVWQAVLVINRDLTNAATVSLSWEKLGFQAGAPVTFLDLADGLTERVTSKSIVVPPLSTLMYKTTTSDANPSTPQVLGFAYDQKLGQSKVRAAALPSRRVVLSARSSLTGTSAWTPVSTNTANAGGTVWLGDSDMKSHNSYFYRLQAN